MESRIREIRKNAKLTQTEFGERIGVKGNTVTGYENGLRAPSNAIIHAIAQEFHVCEDWLRTGDGEMYEQNAHAILDQLAKEYRLGPAGRMVIQAALKMYDIGGEAAFVDMVRELLPVMHEIIGLDDAKKFSGESAQDITAEQSEAQ